MSKSLLLLFDIDHTLIDSGGAGLRALQTTFAKLHGIADPSSIQLDLAGATDRSVFREVTRVHRLEHSEIAWERFIAAYLEELPKWQQKCQGVVLSGVVELLELLQTREELHLSLLSGNLREGAELKLGHHGLSQYFDFDSGAWGGEREDRNELGPLAQARASAQLSRELAAEEILIIGDSPRDIACAQAFGARSLGVATGRFSVEELKLCGADFAVPDLTDSQQILELILTLQT